MEELELKALFQIFKKRWWVILATTIVALSISAIYSFIVLEPIYQSNTTLYVGKNIESSTAIGYNDILLGDRLVNDYRELVKSRLISDIVIKELKLEGMDNTILANKLNVNSKKDTRLIEITATDVSPEIAAQIANKVAAVFKNKAEEIMKVENVQVIDMARASDRPIKPNKRLNLAIAALLGLMAGAGIIFIIEYFDDTIKTPEDIQKYLNLPVIGTIPIFTEEN